MIRKLILFLVVILCAVNARATTYFLATAAGGGSDANSGLDLAHPWLSPNHAVNCGDVILAAASTAYSEANFASGKWGTVSGCSTGNAASVAWLKCTTFDACKITTTSNTAAFSMSTNFWGVQGWEVTNTFGNLGICFQIRPPGVSNLHHIIFANNIANGCKDGGFSAANNGNASNDYIVFVGNIAYNAAQGSSFCTSGFSIYQPVKFDSLAGTHMYATGNFAWSNLDPNPCNGTNPTDGEAVIFDTFDGSQGGLPAPYDQQAVAQNNIGIANGGRCVEVFNNKAGSTHAPIFIEFNTCFGNNNDPNQLFGSCGDIEIGSGFNITITGNLVQTGAATACNATALFAYFIANSAGTTNSIAGNWAYSAAGNNFGISNSAGFSYGSNNSGTNPSFNSTTTPGAPNCGTFTSVPNCMATVISNFTPTAGGASAFGRQPVSTTSINDPLFPQWLCNVNLPPGLVTPGCGVVATGVGGVKIQ